MALASAVSLTSAVVAAILCESCKCYALRRLLQYYLSPDCVNASSSSYSAQEIALLWLKNSESNKRSRGNGLSCPQGNTGGLSAARPTLPRPQDRLLYG